MNKRKKTCSKCQRLINGHPLPIGVNCELTKEKVCFKCKMPIKGHPKPTGANCEFGKSMPSKTQGVQPTKESYFDVGKRKMEVCACCGRLTPGVSSDEVYLYSAVSHTANCHGNFHDNYESIPLASHTPAKIRHVSLCI